MTNALLEKQGRQVPAFIATRGFRDLLELRRSSRADLYDLFQDAPAVLVPRRHRFEITERIDAQGEVVTPLAEDELPGADRGDPCRRSADGRGLVAVFLPQRHARTPVGGGVAGRAAGCRGVSVVRGAAGNPRVRARQHHRGLCLCRTAAGGLSGPAVHRDVAHLGCRRCT